MLSWGKWLWPCSAGGFLTWHLTNRSTPHPPNTYWCPLTFQEQGICLADAGETFAATRRNCKSSFSQQLLRFKDKGHPSSPAHSKLGTKNWQVFSNYGLDSVSDPLIYRIRLLLIFQINISMDEKPNTAKIRESPIGKLDPYIQCWV